MRDYDWHLIETWRKQGLTIRDITRRVIKEGKNFDKEYDHIQKYLKRQEKQGRVVTAQAVQRADAPPPEPVKEETWDMEKGIGRMTIGFIRKKHGQPLTEDDILDHLNLSKDEFEIVTYDTRVWQQQTKDAEIIDLYYGKVAVKLRKTAPIIHGINSFIENFDFKGFKPPKEIYDLQTDGLTMIINIADPHIGMKTLLAECGDNYDTEEAKKRIYACINYLIEQSKGKKIKKIIVPVLGDMLNVDNDKGQTTKGTFVSADNPASRIIEDTLEIFVTILRTLNLSFPKAELEFIYVRGNHDNILGLATSMAIREAFNHIPHISVDADPSPSKIRLIGKVLIGFKHGESGDLISWLNEEASQMPCVIKFKEVHVGHKHAENVVERIQGFKMKNPSFTQVSDSQGVVVRTVPCISPASYYCATNGWLSRSTIPAYFYDDENGLLEIKYAVY